MSVKRDLSHQKGMKSVRPGQLLIAGCTGLLSSCTDSCNSAVQRGQGGLCHGRMTDVQFEGRHGLDVAVHRCGAHRTRGDLHRRTGVTVHNRGFGEVPKQEFGGGIVVASAMRRCLPMQKRHGCDTCAHFRTASECPTGTESGTISGKHHVLAQESR